MPSLEFVGDSSYLWDGFVYRPILPLRLTNSLTGNSLDTEGLVDTGSDLSIIRLGTLKRLGLETEILNTRLTLSSTGSGQTYEATIGIEVCGVHFEALVLSTDVPGLEFEILGRTPLFQHVHFAFEEYAEPWRNRVLWKLPGA